MKSCFKVTWVLSIMILLGIAGYTFAWPMPDTGQEKCYSGSAEIPCPSPGEAFYGQDAQYQGLPRSYTKLGNGGVALPDDAAHVDDGGQWIMTRTMSPG